MPPERACLYVPVDYLNLHVVEAASLPPDPTADVSTIKEAIRSIWEKLRAPGPAASSGGFCLRYPLFFEQADEHSYVRHVTKINTLFPRLLELGCCQTVVQSCMATDCASFPMITTLRAPADKYVSISNPAQIELLCAQDSALSHLDHFDMKADNIRTYVGADDESNPLQDYFEDHIIQQQSAVILTPCDHLFQDSAVVCKSDAGLDVKRWMWTVYVLPFQAGKPRVYMMPADLEVFEKTFLQALLCPDHTRLWFTASTMGFNHHNYFPVSMVPDSFFITPPLCASDALNFSTKFFSLNDVKNGTFLVLGLSYLLQKQMVYIRMWPTPHPVFCVYAPTAREADWDFPVPSELLKVLRTVSCRTLRRPPLHPSQLTSLSPSLFSQASCVQAMRDGVLQLSVVVIGDQAVALRVAWNFLWNSLLLTIPASQQRAWTLADRLHAFDTKFSRGSAQTAGRLPPMLIHWLCSATSDCLGTFVTFQIQQSGVESDER